MWIQEEAKIELDVDFKCAPEEGEKLKVKPCIKFLFFIVDVFYRW